MTMKVNLSLLALVLLTACGKPDGRPLELMPFSFVDNDPVVDYEAYAATGGVAGRESYFPTAADGPGCPVNKLTKYGCEVETADGSAPDLRVVRCEQLGGGKHQCYRMAQWQANVSIDEAKYLPVYTLFILFTEKDVNPATGVKPYMVNVPDKARLKEGSDFIFEVDGQQYVAKYKVRYYKETFGDMSIVKKWELPDEAMEPLVKAAKEGKKIKLTMIGVNGKKIVAVVKPNRTQDIAGS